MSSNPDPSQSSFAFLTKVKYGGVLGKITAVAAVFFMTLSCVAVASWRSPYLLGAIALIAAGSLVFLVLQMKAMFLAHPDLATLEGKEMIEYRQLALRLKGKPTLAVKEIGDSPVLPPPDNLLMFPESRERKDD